jgi:replicative DNA helicase
MEPIKLSMPHDVAIESALIGGLIAHGTALSAEVCDEVSENDFYVNSNKIIFSCVKSLVKDGDTVNISTVSAELDRVSGRLAGVGGAEFLRLLIADAPMANGLVLQARYLRGYTMRRNMILTSQSIAKDASNMTLSPTSVMERAEKSILSVTDTQSSRATGADAYKFFKGSLEDAHEAKRTNRRYRGVPSGMEAWDDAVSGLVPQTMYLICGRPSSGKTAALISIAINLLRSNVPVIFFSIEMSENLLANRFYSSWARVDGTKIGRSLITNSELAALDKAYVEMKGLPLHVFDDKSMTVPLMSSLIRQFVGDCRPRYESVPVVMIDYVQIITPDEGMKGKTEATILKDVTYGARSAASRSGCPCIALCQLNRDSEKATKKRHLAMSDIDGSGRIEQAADTITMLENPLVSSVHQDEGIETIEGLPIPVPWRIVKNRYGMSPVEARMGFDRRFGTYINLFEDQGQF